MLSKVYSTLTEIHSMMSEDRLEAVVLMQAHRKRATELAINDTIDKFAAFSFPLCTLSFTYV